MTAPDSAEYFEGRGCLPHQARVAAEFFAPGAPRLFALVSSAGTGKGFTAAEICSHAVTSGRAECVLVLTHRRPLTIRFEELLRGRNPGLPVVTIDRQRFWEMESRVAVGTNPWPTSGVVVVPADALRHDDVRDGLALGDWGLIVLDDVASAGSDVAVEALQFAVAASGARILWLSRTVPVDVMPELKASLPPDGGAEAHDPFTAIPATLGGPGIIADGPIMFPLTDILLCFLRMAIVNQMRMPRIRWRCYERNAEEIVVMSRLQRVLATFHGRESLAHAAITLARAAASCTYSLEQSLRRLRQDRNRLVHGAGGFIDEGDASVIECSEALRDLPPLIEEISTDSKTAALCDVLDSAAPVPPGHARACVYARFASTVDYLASVLGVRFGNVFALDSRMSLEDRADAVERCAATNGILVLTGTVTTMPPPTHLVALYDLPSDPAILDARVEQFARARGGSQPQLVAFEDSTRSLAIEAVERDAFKAGRRPEEAEIMAAVMSAASAPS